MYVGTDMIGMIKIKMKVFYYYTIDNLTKYWPGDSYLMLNRKSTLTGDKHILFVVYKYNHWKDISFIA